MLNSGTVSAPNVYAPPTPMFAFGVLPLNIVVEPSMSAYVKSKLLITCPDAPSCVVPGSISTGDVVSWNACPVKFATVDPVTVKLGDPVL